MLKRLAILGLFGALAAVCLLAGQTSPLSPPKQGIAKPDDGKNGPQKPDPQTAKEPAPRLIATASQPSAPGCDENCQNQRHNLDIQRKIEWFTGVLAAVGILQGIVLFLTWKAISQQTDFQRFLTRQWVDVGSWSIGGEDAWEMDWDFPSREATKKELKKSMSMGIGFELFNRTGYPLKIDSIVIHVGKFKQKQWTWRTFEDRADLIMPPHSSEGDNSERCSAPFDLDEDEVYRYTKSGGYRRVHVKVFYFDSEGKRVSQDFAVEGIFKENAKAVFNKYSSRKVREIDGVQSTPPTAI